MGSKVQRSGFWVFRFWIADFGFKVMAHGQASGHWLLVSGSWIFKMNNLMSVTRKLSHDIIEPVDDTRLYQ